MQPVLKRGNDTKITTATPQAPKQIRVLGSADSENIAIHRDQIGGDQVVGC
jgi:hypothetical protein